MQMVGVGKDHLLPCFTQLARIERLHRRQCPDGHERGRVHRAVWRHENAGASCAGGRIDREGKARICHPVAVTPSSVIVPPVREQE